MVLRPVFRNVTNYMFLSERFYSKRRSLYMRGANVSEEKFNNISHKSLIVRFSIKKERHMQFDVEQREAVFYSHCRVVERKTSNHCMTSAT